MVTLGHYTVNPSIYIGNPTFNVAVILHSLEVGLLADILLNWWTNDDLLNREQKRGCKKVLLEICQSFVVSVEAPLRACMTYTDTQCYKEDVSLFWLTVTPISPVASQISRGLWLLNLQSAQFYSALIKPLTERICQKNHLDMKSLGFAYNLCPLSIVFKNFKKTAFMPALPITHVRQQLSEYFHSLKGCLKSILL